MDTNWLKDLAHELRTQDNACTAHPVFCVQVKRRQCGLDTTWVDDVCWVEDGELCSPERSAELEKQWEMDGDDDPGAAHRTGYVDHWEHVASFFTRKAAEAFVADNSHRHDGELRVWVDSAYRNPEWQKVVAFLLEASREPETRV